MNFIFDIESSGLPSKRGASYKELDAFDNARIVSICWILAQGDKITEQSYFVVKPDKFVISPESIKIHGISNEQAHEEGVPISEVFKELEESLQHVHSIISYNIEFDINVLRSELYRYKFESILKLVDAKHHVCCMKKAKEFLRKDKFPKLGDAYKLVYGEDMQHAHNAMADTLNCFKLYNKMFPLSRDVFFMRNRKIELTPEQSLIVFAPLDINIAVVASAGSGKTSTICARIKRLVNEGIDEDAILLTTFTRDSSNDMKQKLFDIFGYQPQVRVGTIDTISKVATFYSVHKDKRELKDVGEHAKDYLEHIRKHPEVIERYKYMFVDEFQDINEIQFNIINEFYKNGCCIFAVGDDHQNIYTFRGSSIEYLLGFKSLFPRNSEMFHLTYNFRSTREIINFANASISNNIHQIPKKMVPGIPQSVPKHKPEIRYFSNTAYQNVFVVREIVKLIKEGVLLDEIAVLSPLNNSLFLIEELLIVENIRTVYLDGKSDVRTIKKSGHVCLCTIHKSKGLEWEYVFLTNMSDDMIPRVKNVKSVEEDRRLFYVAVTRAKEKLFITYTANSLTPFVTRYVSEVPSEFYDFIDYRPEYKGVSEFDVVQMEMSVTKLLENLDGQDYAVLKEKGIMPVINLKGIDKKQLYGAFAYLPIIEQEELYTDFGIFVDTLISREVARKLGRVYVDKYALQLIAGVVLDKSMYMIYKLYKNNFKSNIANIDGVLSLPKVISTLCKDCRPIAREHCESVWGIVRCIHQNALEFKLPMNKIPVFTERFLPEEFTEEMSYHMQQIGKKDIDYETIIDSIWEVSKCQSIVTSYRRRMLFMDVKPSVHMKACYEMFDSCVRQFMNAINCDGKDIGIHEELAIDEGVYGELDLRIDDTIIDYKCAISDEISAPWILQLLCYKSLYDLKQSDDRKINKVGIFNPLRGWMVELDVSEWNKSKELITYLIDKRERLQSSTKH